MPIAPGTRFDRYEILRPLGKGGMGEVYLSEDTRLGRKVALKLLPAAFTGDEDRLRRFQQEARAASSLNHPGIITIHEIGEANGAHFMATEFVEGRTLRGLMSSPCNLTTVLDLLTQAASALAAAHAAGIVHRDIKPENIMVRSDGFVKVLDFGLAKLTEPHAPLATEAATLRVDTETGVVMGTARYMSPEQARGLTLDARTDIFSLGVVLYEMLTGQAPFTGDSTADVITAVLQREPLPLARFAPDTPDALARITTKALRKDREERYQTIKDLLIDLRDLKEELAFNAKVEGVRGPDASDSARSGRRSNVAVPELPAPAPHGRTAAHPAARTVAGTRSSAEYLVGEVRRHRVPAAMLTLGLLAAIAALVYVRPFGATAGAIESIAVLPFVNVGANADTEYLTDGITESLINGLSLLPRLRVMSRNSVFRYKGRETDAQAAGRALGVEAVLTGRVVPRGDNLSISTELVHVADNSHLWGAQYNRKLSDLVAIQADISRDISDNLRLTLTGDDTQRLMKRATQNTDAYQLYLKGRYHDNTMTDEGSRLALEYYERAIAADPGYARAYAGLAEAYAAMVAVGSTPDLLPREAIPKARAAAVRALELDDTLPEAHTSLGLLAMTVDRDWVRAESEFKRAIALNPNYVNARHWYSHYLLSMGRSEESLNQSQRALALDPLDVGMNFHLAFHYYMSRQYDQAVAQLERTLGMNRKFADAHTILALIYEQHGRYDDAITELRSSMELGGRDVRGLIAHVYAVSNRHDEARRILAQLKDEAKRTYVSPYLIAGVHAGLGEKDQALVWLEKAAGEQDIGIRALNRDPVFDSLHSDSRFIDLLRRFRLPPAIG
jgi:eukaryotic-like serine/threonine-protein kinase